MCTLVGYVHRLWAVDWDTILNTNRVITLRRTFQRSHASINLVVLWFHFFKRRPTLIISSSQSQLNNLHHSLHIFQVCHFFAISFTIVRVHMSADHTRQILFIRCQYSHQAFAWDMQWTLCFTKYLLHITNRFNGTQLPSVWYILNWHFQYSIESSFCVINVTLFASSVAVYYTHEHCCFQQFIIRVCVTGVTINNTMWDWIRSVNNHRRSIDQCCNNVRIISFASK